MFEGSATGRPKFKIDPNTTQIDFFMPGLDGYERMVRFRAPSSLNPQQGRPERSAGNRRYIRHLERHIYYPHMAICDLTTGRTTKVVTGPFRAKDIKWLGERAKFSRRDFRPDERVSERKQIMKKYMTMFSNWIRQLLRTERMRFTRDGRLNMYHPDALVFGHALEHALGGTSQYTDLSYHAARANIQEISAIEFFGRRLVTSGLFEFAHYVYGDFTRDQVRHLMLNPGIDPYREFLNGQPADDQFCPIPYAVYRLIFAFRGGRWFVFAFIHGQFGLEVDTLLDHRSLENTTLEEHFRRISRYLVDPNVISDISRQLLMNEEEMAFVDAVNSLEAGVFEFCPNREFNFKDPNPEHR